MLRPIILIPSLNPDHRLPDLVEELMRSGLNDVIIVNDGSKETCLPIFETLSKMGCIIYTHAVNLGKGRALKSGINAFLNTFPGSCGVITADADGQHSVADIQRIAKAMEEKPDALVLGVRDFDKSHVPFKSRAGNKITRSLFGYLSGLKLTDTQTGLRGIPASAMGWLMGMKGERFEYEMNMLIECKRHNLDIVEVPIETIYIDENASSHFNPLLDTIRIYSLLAKFATASIGSALLDLGIFALVTKAILPVNFAESIAVGTVAARVCSSLFNYLLNKNVVFAGSHRSGTMLRYYILAVVQMLCSLFLVRYIVPLIGWDEVLIKFLVDTLLFMISFRIQQKWVFHNKGGKVIRYTYK